MSKKKERYWTFIMYPDSAPENWKEILQQTGIKFAISPLHDKDINTDGELKKPHWHVVGLWDGPTTYDRVVEITEELKATIPKRVMSVIGALRYLTHKDNPEKAQYKEEDIICLNNLDIKEIDCLTKTEIEDIKRDIVHIIRDNNIVEYSRLYDMLLDSEMYDHTKVLSTNTIFFVAYLRSRRFCLTNIPH